MTNTSIRPRPAIVADIKACSGAPALMREAAEALAEADELLMGFIEAAKQMKLDHVYGVLRGFLADKSGPEAARMRKALDALETAGVDTREPNLVDVLRDTAA